MERRNTIHDLVLFSFRSQHNYFRFQKGIGQELPYVIIFEMLP